MLSGGTCVRSAASLELAFNVETRQFFRGSVGRRTRDRATGGVQPRLMVCIGLALRLTNLLDESWSDVSKGAVCW